MSKRQHASTTVAADRIAGRSVVFSGLELEDRLGISLEKRLLVRIGERHAFHGRHFFGHILIRIIHGVEHTTAPTTERVNMIAGSQAMPLVV